MFCERKHYCRGWKTSGLINSLIRFRGEGDRKAKQEDEMMSGARREGHDPDSIGPPLA